MAHATQGRQTEFNADRAKVCCALPLCVCALSVCVCALCVLWSFNAKFNFLNYTTVEVESLDERGEKLYAKKRQRKENRSRVEV